MKLVLAEKPSVGMSLSKVLGANKRGDGYMEGNGYFISWCIGHLVELSEPEEYDIRYCRMRKRASDSGSGQNVRHTVNSALSWSLR